jgi:hypothetical protein
VIDLRQARAWSVALLVTLLISVLGGVGQYWLEKSTKRRISEYYQTLLKSDLTSLRLWAQQQQELVTIYGRDPRVAAAVEELMAQASGASGIDLRRRLAGTEALASLRTVLDRVIVEQEYLGFGVVTPDGTFVAGRYDALLGQNDVVSNAVIERLLKGETVISPPFELPEPVVLAIPNLEVGQPVMFAAAPVVDDSGEAVAALGFVLRPYDHFTRILASGSPGGTGETIAFDRRGVAMSNSRLHGDQQLSTLEVKLPGETAPRSLHLVTRALRSPEGVDMKGHLDYRGVAVVGAWTWYEDLALGILIKQDVREAFGVLRNLQRGLWLLVGMLLLASIGLYAVSRWTFQLRHRIKQSQHLGQYRIERKIGEGGMGEVYRARHSLLKRPTAIKLLKDGAQNTAALARFEREVNSTARLSHPNTIAIYDYGRTPDGTFYYAMEYLDGITLNKCVAVDGAQPEARVVHIMIQACGSIAEAHAAGLVHRDIKPSNIMLCERGTLFDFVKIMDFGLVQVGDQTDLHGLTNNQSLTGTPQYLSPEAIRDPDLVDERSDLYQLGAIAYYLITGQPVFSGSNIYEVCAHHLNTQPEPPSKRLGAPLSPDLEEVILRCLEKDKRRRPVSAMALLEAFEACELVGRWSQREARAWWQVWLQKQLSNKQAEAGKETDSSEVIVQLQDRFRP